MQHARLDESQNGIRITGKNISNLRYEDDTALIAEVMRTKEPLDEGERVEFKSGLTLNIQKTKIIASGSITSRQIEGGKWKQWQIFIVLGSKITVDGDSSHEIKRCFLFGRKA